MFGTIKSNLIILAVALVAMFAAIAADAQTIEVKSGSYEVKANGDEVIKFKADVNGVTVKSEQKTKTNYKHVTNTVTKTKIYKTFSLFDNVASVTPIVVLNTDKANLIDSSVTIKKSINGFNLVASTGSVVDNVWDFSASVEVGQFDLKITESLNFDNGTETTKFNVAYDVADSKYKIKLEASDDGAFKVGFKKGY